ncbi:MAG: DUF1223 domain-containing protein [Gammaproteobacteria bacterium]|nr:DUF1223 domain-containing protein [Gammaproteobacteria bacterium]
MKRFIPLLVCVLALAAGSAATAGNRHVVELFTSQGCYSCPPAERLLGKLISSRDDIVALEFHVDYWDDLVYGLAGRWVDPFSDSVYTQRQRRYKARGLQGENGVYTPQAVVDGRWAAVGSNKSAVEALLDNPVPRAASLTVDLGSIAARVRVSGADPGGADVWLYRFDLRRVTRVESGENKGKTLTNHHVVRSMSRLGRWEGGTQEYLVEGLYLSEGENCAVVVQRADQGEVLGAAPCRP